MITRYMFEIVMLEISIYIAYTCALAQAPACTVGELARAVLSDGCAVPSLQEAAKVDRAHSERNAHRLFNRYGLALKVPISYLDFKAQEGEDNVSIPYLKVPDFLKLLLAKYEQLLLGGLPIGEASEELCNSFWERFKVYQPSHLVFEQFTASQRRKCVPILVHGDKGRTLQKSPIFVLSFETPWGLPPKLLQRCAYDNRCTAKKQFHDGRLSWTCTHRLQSRRKRCFECMSECTMECPDKLAHEVDPSHSHQRHNSKGHSFLSRFLIAAVASKTYNRNKRVLPGLLERVAEELTSVFHDGVKAPDGSQFQFVFLGAKGDAEWHFEAAQFTRSYHNTGTKQELEMCPLCLAGGPNCSFSDVSDSPQWAPTLGTTDPWNELPALNHAPFSSVFKADLYKFDPFHVLKFGVFRDCVGSTVVRLCCMQYFDFEAGDSRGIEARFTRAYSMYKLWSLAEGKNITLKQFSKSNFNFEKYKKFAWVNCKGSEVTLLLMWLEVYVRHVLSKELKHPGDARVLEAMLQTIQGGLSYIGIMHSHGLFLPRCCAKTQLDSGFAFLRGYAWLASYCTENKISGYRLRPKLHYFHHLLWMLKQQLEANAPFQLSSATFLCEQNEDFIGRLSRVSRRVAAKTVGVRTTQRYLVKARCLFERLLPTK